jgi:diaminohydroxyphosphoribosylaminopyrimidine deaminase/5-amino-6-(5-phosphoribosylamino)uracil reductase
MERKHIDAALAAERSQANEPVSRADSVQERDRRFMAEALDVAGRIDRRPWPNPPVGALVVKDGRVVGRGAHQGAGTPHAEIHALKEAGQAARGATLYCTLEPCNHTGRTPPCAAAILSHGIARVVAAIRDPNPEVTGGGLPFLASQGVSTTVGVCGREACELIWPFVVTTAFQRPYVLLKTAVSLDGRFTLGPAPLPAEGPRYLTGEAARRDVHVQRRWMDLVLVGEGTLRSDRPRLNGRLVDPAASCPAQDPAPGYVDSDLSWTGGWEQTRYMVFTARDRDHPAVAAKLRADGGQIVPCATVAGRVDPRSLLAAAQANGIHTLMVEGGPNLAAAFLAAGVVDRWVQYIAPVHAGAGLQWPANSEVNKGIEFQLSSSHTLGRDARLIYDRLSLADTVARLTRRLNPDDSERGGE